jgi:hypothetical protein
MGDVGVAAAVVGAVVVADAAVVMPDPGANPGWERYMDMSGVESNQAGALPMCIDIWDEVDEARAGWTADWLMAMGWDATDERSPNGECRSFVGDHGIWRSQEAAAPTTLLPSCIIDAWRRMGVLRGRAPPPAWWWW